MTDAVWRCAGEAGCVLSLGTTGGAALAVSPVSVPLAPPVQTAERGRMHSKTLAEPVAHTVAQPISNGRNSLAPVRLLSWGGVDCLLFASDAELVVVVPVLAQVRGAGGEHGNGSVHGPAGAGAHARHRPIISPHVSSRFQLRGVGVAG